jgi:hypothetical protein
VKPGEKIVGNADLTQLYVLKPGTYSVQVFWWEHYARYHNSRQSRPAAETVVVKSNVIYVKIIARRNSRARLTRLPENL